MRSRVKWVCSVGVAALLATGCGREDDPGEQADVTAGRRSAALTAGQVLPTGPVCAPTGAHAKHGFTACKTCHAVGGVVQFDAAGAAVAVGSPAPSFDATTKTCSSVACHGIPAGTFSWWFPGGDGEPELKTIAYGGAGATTGSWYTTGAGGCTGCHGNPPRNATWHGYHSAGNQCELCHPDAVSSGGVATGLSTATNCGPNGTYGVCAALHANGVVDVKAKFNRTCFNCH